MWEFRQLLRVYDTMQYALTNKIEHEEGYLKAAALAAPFIACAVEHLEDIHMFYSFTTKYHDINNAINLKDKYYGHSSDDTKISMPFSYNWFEFPRVALLLTPAEDSFMITGALVYEVSPTTHTVVVLMQYTETGRYRIAIDNVINGVAEHPAKDGPSLVEMTYYLINEILEESKTKLHVVENTSGFKTTLRGKKKNKKIVYKPSKVIYLGSKVEILQNRPDLHNRIVNKPEYAYEVMGHWRKLPHEHFIGKDRNDEYNQLGWTWVVPHVRGEGEVMKKIRVIR